MKFLKDVLLNIISQALFIAVQQILLFPIFEKNLGQKNFGYFLLIYSVFNVITVTLATSFTNLYQRNFNNFDKELENRTNYYFYYKKLILYYFIASLLFLIVIIYINFSIIIYLLLMLLVFLTISRMFLMVWFRIRKQFINILIVNICLSVLYSLIIFVNINNIIDILIFFNISEFITIIILFLIVKYKIFEFIKADSEIFHYNAINILIISGLAGSMMNYSDRFVIKMLLGSSMITIFYIATLPSKMFLLPFNMLSSVILSYLANSKNIGRSLKRKVLIALPIIFVTVSLISYSVGLILIKILYYSYINDIKDIYFIVTLSFGLICLDFILRSFLLKYFSIGKKAIIDISTLVIFFILSYLFVIIFNNLVSIALAQLFVYIIKVIVQLLIFVKLKPTETVKK
ncbi:hypothetical protein [Staphylococcus hominis]|uniref:hypothetical protein n=2 Tax=Staphylococcus hominis TaxID=1290 RepID=UPI00098BB745|nr:hypothetical protein [Staphylococcus hominis]MDS3882014.1 hypothetical protein [Staphylococcus hominis]